MSKIKGKNSIRSVWNTLTFLGAWRCRRCNWQHNPLYRDENLLLNFHCIHQISTYLVMSQSDDVEQSSAYCLATTIGARHTWYIEIKLNLSFLSILLLTFAPPVALTSQTRPLSQSASRRHNSPIFRPYAKRQLPKAVGGKKLFLLIHLFIKV